MRVNKKNVVLFSFLSLFVCSTSGAKKGNLPAEKKQIKITDASFGCIREMEKVGDMYAGNLIGNLAGTLSVANSENGGVYPPGSIVQLLPNEAMVKLAKGAKSLTNDWEFFLLDVSEQGTKIKQRGFEKIGNMFGTCLSCHQQAAAQDMVCGAENACAPINFPGIDDTKVLISALQKTDKRCSPPSEPLTGAEKVALAKLQELLAKKAEAAAGNSGQE